MMNKDIGILITNIGSPEQATPKAVRKYLQKFLSDPRVVEIPKIAWYPILYGFILPFRAKSSAKLYQKIWIEQGSPLTIFSTKIANKLQEKLQIPVVLGTHYGNPSIQDGLELLRNQGAKKILIFPLYPQYSATTTAASFDIVAETLKHWRDIPALQMVHDYASHPDYIQALSKSIQNTWDQYGQAQHLLFSFHSIPKRFSLLGDPYAEQCKTTARLVAEILQLNERDWSIAFQSRLGRAEWLTPYTDKVLRAFPSQQIKNLQVICPGFAVDCLETLEEIAIRGKEQFLEAGGEHFHYIPALNESDDHLSILAKIILPFISN